MVWDRTESKGKGLSAHVFYSALVDMSGKSCSNRSNSGRGFAPQNSRLFFARVDDTFYINEVYMGFNTCLVSAVKQGSHWHAARKWGTPWHPPSHPATLAPGLPVA